MKPCDANRHTLQDCHRCLIWEHSDCNLDWYSEATIGEGGWQLSQTKPLCSTFWHLFATPQIAMRFIRHYCESEALGKLLSEFKISQVSLFHYTDQAASVGIRSGDIWMTRADYFLDSRELEHGLNVLQGAAETELDEQERESFSEILNALRKRTQSCFVLSFSQNSDSEHLRSAYAGDDGTVLEFQASFPCVIQTGWHSIPIDADSSRAHYVDDAYDFFEGFVVYDGADQHRLAKMACLAYRDCRTADAHVADQFQIVNVLMQCVVLFKSREFEDEEEYRVALIQRPGITESFEFAREHAGRKKVYVSIHIPVPDAATVVARVF